MTLDTRAALRTRIAPAIGLDLADLAAEVVEGSVAATTNPDFTETIKRMGRSLALYPLWAGDMTEFENLGRQAREEIQRQQAAHDQLDSFASMLGRELAEDTELGGGEPAPSANCIGAVNSGGAQGGSASGEATSLPPGARHAAIESRVSASHTLTISGGMKARPR